MKLTRKCSGCKEEMRKEEMIQYTTISGKTSYWYCKKCYEERLSRDKFAMKVCQIFGISTPGPRIWAERQRLHEKFGFTDDDIIDTLTYVYYNQHLKILSESLALVTPTNVMNMRKHKASENREAIYLTNMLVGQKFALEKVQPTEKKKQLVKTYSLDDWV